jgi:hypothetical protein
MAGTRVVPSNVLLLGAVICFVLVAFGVNLGELALEPLGLALFAASFIVR